jgi:hypothetical protein
LKYNLKNRPKAKYPHNSITEKWFRGFEAELRAEKTALEKRMANEQLGLAKAHFDGRWSFIKELLGE